MPTILPNAVKSLLELFVTLLLTSSTPERTFPTVKILKTYFKHNDCI